MEVEDNQEKVTISKSSSSIANQEENDYIFIRRNLDRYLQEEVENSTATNENDDDFYVNYDIDDDALLGDFENETVCDEFSDPNETECEEEKIFKFDFSGTTSDQDLCISKQFGEISSRNIKGNVYAYVFDDGTDLNGYRRRRRMQEDIRETHRRLAIIPTMKDFEYDEESLYFFDNVFMTGNNLGGEFVRMRKELFNRWINFAKTGEPKYSGRSNVESKKYELWLPFPKAEDSVGLSSSDDNLPSYLYMPAEPRGRLQERKGQERSRMIPFNQLVTKRTQTKYKSSGMDICSWVLDEANDNDGVFVDVLLDFNANTAFDYYVTVLATMNPTINYVPEREYIAKMPPTLSPTTVQYFVDQSIEKHSSAQGRSNLPIWMLGISALAVANIVVV